MEDQFGRPPGAVLTERNFAVRSGRPVRRPGLSIEAPIAFTAFIRSPDGPTTLGRSGTPIAGSLFLADLHGLGSAGPDPATRTGSSRVEDARAGLPTIFPAPFVAVGTFHRSPSGLMTPPKPTIGPGSI